MKDEEIIAIAKQVWGERLGVEYSTSEPVGYADCNHTFKPTNKLIAFARAIADIQKQKDAQICEHMEDAMHRIKQWCDAYPLDIFPEPDFKHAAEVLKAAGITIDAISASNMRHVLKGVSEIASGAIRSPESDIDQATRLVG